MIKKLLNNTFTTLTGVLLIAALLRLPALWLIPQLPVTSKIGILGGLVEWVNHWKSTSILVSFVFVVAQALLLNYVCKTQGLITPTGYLPAYFFILIQSIYPENLFFTEYQLGNIFIFLGLAVLFHFKNQYSRVTLFYSSILFGVAILLVPDHLMILLFLIASVLVFKNIVAFDVLSIVFGLAMPYYFAKVLEYLGVQSLGRISDITVNQIKPEYIVSDLNEFYWNNAIYGCFAVLIIFGLLKEISKYYQYNVEIRRSKRVVILFFIYSLSLISLHWKDIRDFHLLAAFPSAIFLTAVFNNERPSWWMEILNILLFLVVIYSLYFS